ncbi:MAG: hypothetical protein HY658_08725 [Actinobacteria bacterium]|nr:hypothetical protein [Actinomycetota bacterium]
MEFPEALDRLGFTLAEERREARLYASRPNRYLTYWVHAFDDGTALFTWEFAIADYLAERGIQVGSNEELNTYLYPREDARGPQEAGWLAGALDEAEARLAGVRLDAPEGQGS